MKTALLLSGTANMAAAFAFLFRQHFAADSLPSMAVTGFLGAIAAISLLRSMDPI